MTYLLKFYVAATLSRGVVFAGLLHVTRGDTLSLINAQEVVT